MINLKKKTSTDPIPQEDYRARFQDALLSAMREVVFGEDLESSLETVLAGIRRAFEADVFMFSRSGGTASLAKYSAGNPEHIAGLLRKAGIRLAPDNIPLSGGRDKFFQEPLTEHDDLFDLVGDMTTSAACRKIQADLRFEWIVSASTRIGTLDLALVLLLSGKPATLKQDIDRFITLLKAAYHLSARKERLRLLETKFDEQFVKLKNEIREKESGHEAVFNEIDIPAAVLDERGVVTEANLALHRILGPGANPVGQPFSSIINESDRRDFLELFMNLGAGENALTAFTISDRHFKLNLVTRKIGTGQRGQSAVFLIDDTSDLESKSELGRTIDTLRSEKESADRFASGIRKYSEDIVRTSAVATLVVGNGIVKLASGSAAGIFRVTEGEPFDQFMRENGLSIPSEEESVSEVTDSEGRILSVARWQIGDDTYVVFDDISGFRRAEEELRKSYSVTDRLFNGFLPTAAVSGGAITRRNDMFESLFKGFLSSDESFDGFLRYIGEPVDAFKSELASGGVVMRNCRTSDRMSLNVSASQLDDTIYLFVEDITDQENTKQQLRAAQGLLSSLLESFSEEPVFVVENGVVRAANVAARQKLPIRLDERIDPAKVLAGIGIVKSDDTGELNGQFYKVENTAVGGMQVYRFRLFNQEVAQRAEFERLRRRQEIMRHLSSADKYEVVLQLLGELLKIDGVASGKIISAGLLHISRGIAEVWLTAAASGKMESALSFGIAETDLSAAKHGGALSGIELPDTTFMNVISGGSSVLLIQTAPVGDSVGFAAVALPPTGVSPKYLEDLGQVLKGAASVAAGLHARTSVERKFEESGKVTRAVVGLVGVGDGPFEETARKSVDLLRQVFGADSVGVYTLEGATTTRIVRNGSLPETLSLPAIKFGSLTPVSQLDNEEMSSSEGNYFAVKSRRQKTALIFIFASGAPSLSELNAVSAVSLDMLEARRFAEERSKVADGLVVNLKSMSEFMTRLSQSTIPEDVVRLLSDSLASASKDSSVSLGTAEAAQAAGRPMEIVAKEAEAGLSITVNFSGVGLGVLTATLANDPLLRTMVELAVDKIRSIYAMKLPAAQNEAAALQASLNRARIEEAELRESIEKIPVSMRNARIGIDNAMSRLSFLQGDEKILQEIRMYLASAAKEVSADLDSSSRTQAELFDAVRAAVAGRDREEASPKISSFETSMMSELRFDQTTFDLLRDLFSNFISMSGAKECEVLMSTSQPGRDDASSKRGKKMEIRIKSTGPELLDGESLQGSSTMRAIEQKLEKLGFALDANIEGSEMILEVAEVKAEEKELPGGLSAILVEDDKQLVEEESQLLLRVFARLKVAGDAVEAERILRAEKFDIAFVDLSLPSINGKELCAQIKQQMPGCTTVLLTNREGEEKSTGVDNIALRPLDDETVRSLIEKHK